MSKKNPSLHTEMQYPLANNENYNYLFFGYMSQSSSGHPPNTTQSRKPLNGCKCRRRAAANLYWNWKWVSWGTRWSILCRCVSVKTYNLLIEDSAKRTLTSDALAVFKACVPRLLRSAVAIYILIITIVIIIVIITAIDYIMNYHKLLLSGVKYYRKVTRYLIKEGHGRIKEYHGISHHGNAHIHAWARAQTHLEFGSLCIPPPNSRGRAAHMFWLQVLYVSICIYMSRYV